MTATKVVIEESSLEELLSMIREVVKEELADTIRHQEEQLLNTDEACKCFSPVISRQTLSSYVKKGWVEQCKLGSTNYYKRSSIITSAKTVKRYRQYTD
jgi:hypothetical protein